VDSIADGLRGAGPDSIALVTSDAQSASLEFKIGTEARILGAVDLELRFLGGYGQASLSRCGTTLIFHRTSANPGNRLGSTCPSAGNGQCALLKKARLRAGLSFRSASKLSREIAKTLGDDRYFASYGTLSDYEAGDKLPRHIHKLFTLSIIYSLAFRGLLGSFWNHAWRR